jgi:hypothetical protein
MEKSSLLAVLFVTLAVALVGISYAAVMYVPRMMNSNGRYSTISAQQNITIAQAVQSFKSYLTYRGSSDIALHEVEEYQYNFYASYYEKSTGRFAFQMLIWKPGSTSMYGMISSMTGGTGMMVGVVMPEPGPNMMWNTKYAAMNGMMGSNIMGGGMMGSQGQATSASMTVSPEQAKTIAQQYLDTSLAGKTAGDADSYYGYYTIDVLSGGYTYGMISVNGYTGQVWYHSWHGTYVQTVTVG